MNRNKKLFGRKTNRYFNHRIGAYNAQRSIWSSILLPSLTLFIIGGIASVGYVYYQQNNVVLSINQNPEQIEKVAELSQEQIDQKALQAKEDPLLVQVIKDKIDEMPKASQWEVSLRDLKSGRMANVNSDELMPSASLYKMFLLAPLEKRLSADYWKSYIGSQSINDCVSAMIKVSDNDCPKALANYANWRNIDPHNQSLGFTQTQIGKEDSQVTNAKEVNDLMYRLQNSQILSDKARRLVFDALYEQQYRDGIPAGCGQGCLIANKTGDLDGYKHDAAIVTHGSAQYVLIIMTKDASWEQIAELSSVIDREMLP